MSRIIGLTDPASSLTKGLVAQSGPGQPTSVLVGANGVISKVVSNATDPSVLRDQINALIPA
ncbi:hypothetical protein [Fodinicola feengrottensis]|nr:hypothetical protein [Fodinicola feengrottensis]